MNEKQRKKAVKELREKIIPKIKARNLANDPDNNLKGQGVYRVQGIFSNFDSGMGKELGEKLDKLIQARRKEIKEGQIDRAPHAEDLANDIVNYINLKTEEMDHYRISEKPASPLRIIKYLSLILFLFFAFVGLYLLVIENWKIERKLNFPFISLIPPDTENTAPVKPNKDSADMTINNPQNTIITKNQVGNNTIINNDLDLPGPKITLEPISRDEFSEPQNNYITKYKLVVDSVTPLKEMYIVAQAPSLLNIDASHKFMIMKRSGEAQQVGQESTFRYVLIYDAQGEYTITLATREKEPDINIKYATSSEVFLSPKTGD